MFKSASLQGYQDFFALEDDVVRVNGSRPRQGGSRSQYCNYRPILLVNISHYFGNNNPGEYQPLPLLVTLVNISQDYNTN